MNILNAPLWGLSWKTDIYRRRISDWVLLASNKKRSVHSQISSDSRILEVIREEDVPVQSRIEDIRDSNNIGYNKLNLNEKEVGNEKW